MPRLATTRPGAVSRECNGLTPQTVCLFLLVIFFATHYFTGVCCVSSVNTLSTLLPTTLEINARYNLVSTQDRQRCHSLSSSRRKRGLLAMPVGQPLKIKKSLFEMVKRFDKRRFDVILFHYDPDDNIGNWEELNKHANFPRVRHIFDPHKIKLDYARAYLTPTVVCAYDYVFLWDEDGIVPRPGLGYGVFSADAYLDIVERDNLSVSGPAFTSDSTVSYPSSLRTATSRKDSEEQEFFIEIGFQVWKSEAWLYAHAVLQRFPFRLWYFDTLPWKCVASPAVKKIGLVNAFPLQHVRQSDEGRLRLDTNTIHNDRAYWDRVIGLTGCCFHLQRIQYLHREKDEKKWPFLTCSRTPEQGS